MTTTVKLDSSGLVKVTGGSETTIINVNETYATSSAASDAQSTASAAQSTTSAAQSTATAAQSTANAANSTASAAQSTATAASTTASNAQSTANAVNNILTNGSRVHCFAVTDSTSDSTLTEHDSETTYSQKNYIFPSVDTQGIIIFENTTNIDRHLTTTGTSYVIHNEFNNYNRLEQNCHVIFVSKENNLNWRKLGTIRKTRFIDLI